MNRSHTDRPSFRDDQRGAIMVVGVFMAILLAGAIFYIIGTGEAIIYRQRVQDGADAIAFTSAAIHAKGMNIIVLLNLIMAALVTILVAMKTIQLLNNIALPIAKVACIVPGGQVACVYIPFGLKIKIVLAKAIPTYQNVFLRPALFALASAQTGIAIGTPWASLVKARQVGDHYKPLVDNSFVVSPSMVPFIPDGKKLGLPVKYEDYDKLCQKAGENIMAVFGFLPKPLAKGLQTFGGMVTSSFSGYFCGDLGKGAGGYKQMTDLLPSADELADMVKDACDKKADSEGEGFDKDDCIAKGTEDAQKELESSKEDMTSEPVLSGNSQKAASFGGKVFDYIGHKELIDGANVGGGHFQVYGITIGQDEWPRAMDKGVAIASKAGVNPPLSSWGKYRIAQAEFFWDGSGKIDKDEVMWERMWTARLRRLRPELPELGAGFASALLGKSGLKDIFDKVLINHGDSPLDFLLGKVAKDKLGSLMGDLVKGIGSMGDKWANSKVSQFLQTPEMIH